MRDPLVIFTGGLLQEHSWDKLDALKSLWLKHQLTYILDKKTTEQILEDSIMTVITCFRMQSNVRM